MSDSISRSIVLLSLMLCFLNAGFARPADIANEASQLPGGNFPIEELVSPADLIAVGILVELGYGSPRMPGFLVYRDAKFKIKRRIKGRARGTITIRINVHDGSVGVIHEGQKYVIICEQLETEMTVQKMFPADANSEKLIDSALSARH